MATAVAEMCVGMPISGWMEKYVPLHRNMAMPTSSSKTTSRPPLVPPGRTRKMPIVTRQAT